MRRGAVLTASAMFGLASIVAVGATAGASARTPQLPQAVNNSTFTLNLLGAPLIIDVTTDPGGNLVDVALNPPTPPADITATTVKPNKIVFVNTAGSMKLRVSAKHGGQSVTARAATLLDVSGTGSWAGDVFGTGEATTVNYTVGALTDGSPNVTIDSVTSPLTSVIGATEYHPADGDGHGAKASASVEFTGLGQSRSLTVDVRLHDKDGATTAELRVSLSRIKGAQTANGEAVGPHTWTGTLCDSTTATFDYTVAADGSVTVGTLPMGATATADEHGTSVRFATGERVQIKVNNDNGTIAVGTKVSLHCEAAVPSVNTPVVTTVPESGNGKHHGAAPRNGDGPIHGSGSRHSGGQHGDG